jgi:hypothetical protein
LTPAGARETIPPVHEERQGSMVEVTTRPGRAILSPSSLSALVSALAADLERLGDELTELERTLAPVLRESTDRENVLVELARPFDEPPLLSELTVHVAACARLVARVNELRGRLAI